MSVEITGAAGYDYQDLICLYVSILLSEQESIQVKIENPNGEDCEIKYVHNEEEYIIDVQVKNRANFIEINEFGEWISHFEKHSSDIHLLRKLKEDKNRFLLFVTNNRVENILVNFVLNEESSLHIINDKGFSNVLIDNLKISIMNSIKVATPLSVKRKSALENFCLGSSNNIFRAIFKKVKIWELKNEELVKEQIRIILNTKYLVPKSKVKLLVFELLDIIKRYKGTNRSVLEELITKINTYSEDLVFPIDIPFIENEEFPKLEKVLKDNHLLLLSGVSLCGKSFNAKKLASIYQQEGYYCLITSEIDEALNFVSKRDTEDRILILEDPCGAITPEQRGAEILRKLNIICQKSNVNNKVIVTSRSDILLNVFNVGTLSSCNINGSSWFDLTNIDTTLIENFWNIRLGNNEKASSILEAIITYLKKHSTDNYLQIGELSHLINTTSIDTLEEMDISQVIDIARVNASNIANFIINDLSEVYKKVFLALTLGCNTTKPIDPKHLHYILSESAYLYSIRYNFDDYGIVSYNLIEEEGNDEIIWDYNGEFDNIANEEYKRAILYFKKCGYINITREGVIFNHPIYLHAGYLIIIKELELEYYSDESIYAMLKRGLATTSKFSSNSTIKVLEYLYTNLDIKDRILEILLLASKSIFPSVIDRSTLFLIKHFDDFEKEVQKDLIDTVMINKDNAEIIKWNDGEPFIFQGSLNMSRFIENLLDQRDSNISVLTKESLTSKDVWDGLKIEYNNGIKLEYLEFLKKATFFDEVFIKEKAYFKLFNIFVHEDLNLINLLKYNEHPSIIYKSFIGAFHSWEKYSAESKEIIINVLKNYIKEPPVSIRFLRFLENFQDEYITDGINWSELNDSQKNELWKVWYELFNQIFDTFPFDFKQMHEAHLVAVARDSLKFIDDSNLVVQFALKWHKWLKSLKSISYPEDFGMSVAAYLMKGTANDSVSRRGIFQMLLDDEETSLITTHLSHFVNYWGQLDRKEKDLILNLINSSREDIMWIKSILLTGEFIPDEVLFAIFGENILEYDTNKVICELKNKELLGPCLNIYTGFPQPLWWNGYHHKNNAFWDNIICEILVRKNIDTAFKLALKEFIDNLYNRSNRYKNGLELYESLLQDENIAKLVFEELLLVSATQNQSNKKMWDSFIGKSYFSEDPFYLNLILENIDALQYQQLSDRDLMEYFDWDYIYKNIILNSEDDKILLNYINLFKNGVIELVIDKDTKIHTLNWIKISLDYSPPKLSLVNKIIKIELEKSEVLDEEFLRILERNRKMYITKGSKNSMEFKDQYDLENWIA